VGQLRICSVVAFGKRQEEPMTRQDEYVALGQFAKKILKQVTSFRRISKRLVENISKDLPDERLGAAIVYQIRPPITEDEIERYICRLDTKRLTRLRQIAEIIKCEEQLGSQEVGPDDPNCLVDIRRRLGLDTRTGAGGPGN
jgi:hypothetical protein